MTSTEQIRAWKGTPRGHELWVAARHRYRRLHPESERRRQRRRRGWPEHLLDLPPGKIDLRTVLAAWRRWRSTVVDAQDARGRAGGAGGAPTPPGP